MNRRGFVGTALAGIGSFFLPRQTVKAAVTEPFWSPGKRELILQCRDLRVLQYFVRAIRWLNLNIKLDEIDDAYRQFGRAFVHLNIACPICFGDCRKNCNHPDGTIQNIAILSNHLVVKSGSSFALLPSYFNHRYPPVAIKSLIEKNVPIPLSNRTLVVVDSLVDKKFVEEKILRPIAEMQGFLDEEPFEERRGGYLYPHVILS